MMKNRAIKIILFLLLASCSVGLYSQDTIKDASASSFDFIDSKYKNRKSALKASFYLNAEDVTLWRSKYLDGFTSYGALLNYEFKFAKSHSINSGVKAYITNKKYENLRIFTSYRFYHNLKGRISLGKTGDNFAANYFFIEPSYAITRSPYKLSGFAWDFNQGKWALTYKKEVEKVFNVWLGYGLQRNVFKNFNVDANIGLNPEEVLVSNYNQPYFMVQFSFGYIIR